MSSKTKARTAFVAGSAGLIGGLVSERLLAAGPHTYGSTFNDLPCDALARHPNFSHISGFDVASRLCRNKALERVEKESGRLDCLVLAVGTFLSRKTSQTSQDELESLFRLNAAAPFALACEAERLLSKAESPKIIFFADSTTDSLAPRKLVAGYAAAKAGLLILAKSLAYDWRDSKVKIAVIGVPPIANAPPGMAAKISPEAVADFAAAVALDNQDFAYDSGDLLEI